jgi:hypothetical protein
MLSLNLGAEDDAIGSGSNPAVPHGRAETVHEIVQHVGREYVSLEMGLNVPISRPALGIGDFYTLPHPPEKH